MKTAMMIFSIVFLFVFRAGAEEDSFIDILKANHGTATGHSSLGNGSCQIRIYAPGEYAHDSEYYVESTYENSSNHHIAAYPNNGTVVQWALELGALTVYYLGEPDYTRFLYDQKSLKILSFHSSKMSCEGIH